MADIYFKADAHNLLKKKHIVFFGDSNMRALYKDLIWLLNRNQLIDQKALRRKQEESFYGDTLKKHSELHRGREYKEERSYKKGDLQVEFYFITRCYNPLLVDMMEDIHLGIRDPPDVIYINSTVWDFTRWGPNCVNEFKDNLQKLARLMKSSLPSTTLVIWATALPVSNEIQGSLLIKQLEFLRHTLRFDAMEANNFARQVMVNHGFDVLDNHFYMRMQVHRRVHDGIHYFPTAVRLLTNLLLTHLALSWDVPLPNRVDTILLNKTKVLCGGRPTSPIPEIHTPKVLSNKTKKHPPLPPHILTKMPDYDNPRKNTKPYQIQKKVGKPKGYRRGVARPTPYQRIGEKNLLKDKPPTLEERLLQLSGFQRVDRRNGNWRQGSEKQQMWSETPPPAMSPWLPWNNPPQNTNWSEDQWPPDGQSFQNGQMFNNNPRLGVNYNSNRYMPPY